MGNLHLLQSITSLFKQANLNIYFRATNIIQQQLTEKQTNKNTSGIYKLKCNSVITYMSGSQVVL